MNFLNTITASIFYYCNPSRILFNQTAIKFWFTPTKMKILDLSKNIKNVGNSTLSAQRSTQGLHFSKPNNPEIKNSTYVYC